MRHWLKRQQWLVAGIQRLGRFRFGLKIRRARSEGVGFANAPVAYARYVLADPETHSYSYDLENEDELVDFLAELTATRREVMAGYLAEAHADPELNRRLRSRTRWRIDAKTRMPLGNRLLWYGLARAVRPATVVETGIHDGLGSLVLLAALARNAAEGAPGRLISLDFDPRSGWVVPPRMQARWTKVCGPIEETLEPALAGIDVDLFIHESDHNHELQQLEFGAALDHAADPLWVVDSSGDVLPVLADLVAGAAGQRHVFQPRPRRHFFRPDGTAVARFEANPRDGLTRTGKTRRFARARGGRVVH